MKFAIRTLKEAEDDWSAEDNIQLSLGKRPYILHEGLYVPTDKRGEHYNIIWLFANEVSHINKIQKAQQKLNKQKEKLQAKKDKILGK